MQNPSRIERKSANRLAFEHYLRTGQRLTAAEWRAREERKFNPYHDELGRFTFAPGAAGMGAAPPPPRPTRRSGQVGTRTVDHAAPAASPRTRIAPMPGYPESGRTSWRSANDAAFIAAADFYNRKYGLKPGDEEFRTPEFLKAWAMREAGGEGDEAAFRSDPFQVNNPPDWVPEKQWIAGLRKGQRMTPAMSAYAALEWLRYKSYDHDGYGKLVRYRGDQAGLEKYNTVSARTRQSGNLPHKVWYASTILQMAEQASAGRK